MVVRVCVHACVYVCVCDNYLLLSDIFPFMMPFPFLLCTWGFEFPTSADLLVNNVSSVSFKQLERGGQSKENELQSEVKSISFVCTMGDKMFS